MKIYQSEVFKKWLLDLKDLKLKASILARLERIRLSDNLGDFKSIDKDIKELRFFNKGGARIYFNFKNGVLIVLLNAGFKDTQEKDIKKAKELLKEFDDE